MKKIFLALGLLATCFSNAQTLSYTDIGELFSKEKINGTARFNGMSGAFGALGGDISAIEINPAGAAVFTKSEFAASLNVNTIKTDASFYGLNMSSENDKFDLSQVGGIMVFKSNSNNSPWSKFALAFNYQIVNDYENLWTAKGNSGSAPITDIYDPTFVYDTSEGHYFENLTDGNTKKYTVSFASEYNNNLMLGFSLSTYDVQYHQNVLTEEYNNDGSGNTFDISQHQELKTYGSGISLNFGLIAKATDNLRLGLALQTPTWYALSEDFLEYDVNIFESNNTNSNDYSGVNGYDYNLKTPSKITGSIAYIFDKSGLVSLDYIYKDYSNIKLSKGNFTPENNTFKSDLEGSAELRLGTEWRFGAMSVRGGYHYEKNPYKYAYESDDIEGFSVGAGVKFRGGKLDVSYQKSNNTAAYSFYNDAPVNAAELDINTSKVTATLVLNL